MKDEEAQRTAPPGVEEPPHDEEAPPFRLPREEPPLGLPDEGLPSFAPPWEAGGSGEQSPPPQPASSEPGPDEWYSDRFRRASKTAPGPSPALSRTELLLPTDVAGWLTTVGLAVALASLFLPWVNGNGFLIGAPGVLPRSWLSSWGIGAVGNWVPGILLLGALVLVLRTTPDPLRHGIAPLCVGLFGLGNVWPYAAYAGRGWVEAGVWLMFIGCSIAVAGAAVRLAPRFRPLA